jgi:hypothetical protein
MRFQAQILGLLTLCKIFKEFAPGILFIAHVASPVSAYDAFSYRLLTASATNSSKI